MKTYYHCHCQSFEFCSRFDHVIKIIFNKKIIIINLSLISHFLKTKRLKNINRNISITYTLTLNLGT